MTKVLTAKCIANVAQLVSPEMTEIKETSMVKINGNVLEISEKLEVGKTYQVSFHGISVPETSTPSEPSDAPVSEGQTESTAEPMKEAA